MTAENSPASPCRTVGDAHLRDAAPAPVRALFFVTGQADPGLVPRLVEPFAKLGLTPARVHASCEDRDGREINADLRVDRIDRQTAHLLDKALRRVVGVRSVIALVE